MTSSIGCLNCGSEQVALRQILRISKTVISAVLRSVGALQHRSTAPNGFWQQCVANLLFKCGVIGQPTAKYSTYDSRGCCCKKGLSQVHISAHSTRRSISSGIQEGAASPRNTQRCTERANSLKLGDWWYEDRRTLSVGKFEGPREQGRKFYSVPRK